MLPMFPIVSATAFLLICTPMNRSTQQLQIASVLCVADLAGKGTLSVVEFKDGRYGVYCDDELHNEEFFSAREMNDCIRTFLALKWEHSRALDVPTTADYPIAASA
jgi:hypothetical protein